MRIPVFVSAPTALAPSQANVYKTIILTLTGLGLERRALGRSDYPTEYPLKEVIQIARRCSGGVVLGFVQTVIKAGISKPGTSEEKSLSDLPLPTPWNQLEAGILFSLKVPILVFRERGVTGGVFDHGVTDVFVQNMPTVAELKSKNSPVREVLLKWQAQVRSHYYEWDVP